jgi:hypothetical protein
MPQTFGTKIAKRQNRLQNAAICRFHHQNRLKNSVMAAKNFFDGHVAPTKPIFDLESIFPRFFFRILKKSRSRRAFFSGF